jgi:hypothetical protein
MELKTDGMNLEGQLFSRNQSPQNMEIGKIITHMSNLKAHTLV